MSHAKNRDKIFCKEGDFEEGKRGVSEVNGLNRLRVARDGYMLISIIFYITGALYMFLSWWPPQLWYLLGGSILIAYGVVKILGYLSDDLYCLAFQYDLACGLLLMVIGCIVMIGNRRIESYLIPGIGLLILLDALLKIQTSKDAREFGLKTWKEILTASIAAGVFGVLIIVKPFAEPQTMHMIVGCGLLLEGFMNQLTVMRTVKMKGKNEG